MYEERKIPKYSLVFENGELVCEECGQVKSRHVFADVQSRGHVFRPATLIDPSVTYGTFSWEQLEKEPSKISDFVRFQVARHRAPSMWFASLTDRDKLTKELEQTCDDIDLPVLDRSFKKHGLALSWKNGVYFLYQNKFLPYDKIRVADYPSLSTHYIDAWFHEEALVDGLWGAECPSKGTFPEIYQRANAYEYRVCRTCGRPERYHIDNNRDSCAKKDLELQCMSCGNFESACRCVGEDGEPLCHCYDVDVVAGLRGIKTPEVDGILDTQLSSYPDYVHVYFWIFVMLGRYLFPLDRTKYDDWQKLFCLFGNAGTGKSCILQIVQKLIPPDCFKPLAMNSQETFGLEALVGPDGQHMWSMVMEVTGKFRIPPQQIQSLVSGESLSINRKGKVAYSTNQWSRHMLIAGNSKPSWQDLGFALVRRLFPIYMRVDVAKKDMMLVNRVEAHSLDAFVFKCVTAYLHAITHYRTVDLWDKDPYKTDGSFILPKTIVDFNSGIRSAMNPLWKMLEADLGTCRKPMTLHKRMCIAQTDFAEEYQAYCRLHFKKVDVDDLTPDIYLPVFNRFGIRVITARRRWKDRWVTTTFFDGIGFDNMCVFDRGLARLSFHSLRQVFFFFGSSSPFLSTRHLAHLLTCSLAHLLVCRYEGIIAREASVFVRREQLLAGNGDEDEDDPYDDDVEGGGDDPSLNIGPLVGDDVGTGSLNADGGNDGSGGLARTQTFWQKMAASIRADGQATSRLTMEDWKDLVNASGVQFGWDELSEVVNQMQGMPPIQLIENLCHRTMSFKEQYLSGEATTLA